MERLGVRAEAMADRAEKLQFTVRSSVVSFDARLDEDIVLDIVFLFLAAYADSVSESCGVRHNILKTSQKRKQLLMTHLDPSAQTGVVTVRR